MNKLISYLLIIIILTTTLTSCTFEKSDEVPVDLPSSVDLRNYDGQNYVTPVKRQLFGDCWSFGISAAAEISYLYANDMGVPTGQVNDAVDFSEKYNVWYVYHDITDDDVILGKVRASQVGEGYDVSKAENKYADAVYTIGGAIYSGSNLYASGFAPVDESVSINGEYPYAYKGKYSEVFEGEVQYSPDDDWSLPLNATYRNPLSAPFFRDSFLLPSPATIDENEEYKFNESGVTAIKTELYKGHGVAVAALVYGTTNYDHWATYNRRGIANHVVTIVGYDDNYPKENFALYTADGEIDIDSIPPTDGAFIIKNSYGGEGLENSGYFYLSYHDHTISYPISFEFDSTDSVKCQKPNYDQYDMLMIGWNGYKEYESETKIANIFDAQMDETLYQIIYKTVLPDTSVHYEIYKNPTEGVPDSGKLLAKGDNSHIWGGYHRIDLKKEYNLKKGEIYSIVLTMTHRAEDESIRFTDVIPYASNIGPDVKANGIINKGESFLFSNGNWTDMSYLVNSLSKHVYSQSIKENLPDDFKALNSNDIAIDNYPIKGILIPSSEQ